MVKSNIKKRKGTFSDQIRASVKGLIYRTPVTVGNAQGVVSVPNLPGRVYVQRDGSNNAEIAWIPASAISIGIQAKTRVFMSKLPNGDYQILDDDVPTNASAKGTDYTAIPPAAMQNMPLLVNNASGLVQGANFVYLASFMSGVPYVVFGEGIDRIIHPLAVAAQRVATVTITDTTETTISDTYLSGANTSVPVIAAGTVWRITASGVQTTIGVTYTVRVKFDGSTLLTFTLPGTSVSTGWRLVVDATIRTAGTSGTIIANGVLMHSGGNDISAVNATSTVNTSGTFTVTAQASATGSISCSQYLMELG